MIEIFIHKFHIEKYLKDLQEEVLNYIYIYFHGILARKEIIADKLGHFFFHWDFLRFQ